MTLTPLPTNITDGQADHAAIHNATNTRINTISALFGGSGEGSPEGVVTAPVGTDYTDTLASTGAVKWVKASGSGNTGWVTVGANTGKRLLVTADVAHAADAELFVAESWIQRSGNIVSGMISIVGAAGGLTAGAAKVTLPAGFRPASEIYLRSYSMNPVVFDVSGAIGFYADLAEGVPDRIFFTVATADAWPATQPGSGG